MLISSLFILLVAMPLLSKQITPILFNRIVAIVFILSAMLSANSLYVESLSSGVGLYSGLFHVTTVSLSMDTFIFVIGAVILLPWAAILPNSNTFRSIDSLPSSTESTHLPLSNTMTQSLPTTRPSYIEQGKQKGDTSQATITEYGLLILFSTIGASLLISSSDLLSMFLSIELQSFAVYLLATLYRDSETATAAGLKYFLLGGFSSALILMGASLIYSATGLTQLEGIYSLTSVLGETPYTQPLILGLLFLLVGFLFKVAAAPFHNWAPDVYDGVPTIVTTWLTIMPKISIFLFLFSLQIGIQGSLEGLSLSLLDSDGYVAGQSMNLWKDMLLLSSLLSLLVGTIAGLAQVRIKRLLAFSTISHVGFLLIALAVNTESSIAAFLFYLIQYSLTNLNAFLILLAFGYIMKSKGGSVSSDVQFIHELKGLFKSAPLLSFSFILCFFSMAGIPPLLGFFAKQQVLLSATQAGYYFLSLVAILVSVISAAYYLRIVRTLYFSPSNSIASALSVERITTLHSFTIAILTFIIMLFVLAPTVLLNSTQLLALSMFY